MADFLKPYLKLSPTNIILLLHVATNNSINDSSRTILKKLLSLKSFVHSELPGSNVIFSKIIDNIRQWYSMVENIKLKYLNSPKMDIIDNSNISSEQLNGFDLHLNRHGKSKLHMNLIKRLRELHRKNYNRN